MIYLGDCVKVLAGMDPESVDACVTDPPYELGFMGKAWDGTGVAYRPETWAAVLRVLKPGAHLLAFGGSRTHHRLACAIEDAGFEIRDVLMWLYGTGFPKSLDVSKAIDASAGVTRDTGVPYINPGGTKPMHTFSGWESGTRRQPMVTNPATHDARRWQGWGTALKPAYEPIILARKPLVGTVAANVLQHGTGALNIDACRIATTEGLGGGAYAKDPTPRAGQDMWTRDRKGDSNCFKRGGAGEYVQPTGRWPANVVLDEEAGAMLDAQSGVLKAGWFSGAKKKGMGFHGASREEADGSRPSSSTGDNGGASRFFYCAKASKAERGEGNNHPTVKPIALMRWLVRLVTPPGGVVLDPFMGSGTTWLACSKEGFEFMGVEKDAHYVEIAKTRFKRRVRAK